MNPKAMIDALGAKYQLIVRTQYHVQIAVQGGYHDLWITKQGLRVKLYGQRENNFIIDIDALFARLAGYNYDVTDQAALMAMIRKAGSKKGIFVDAGFKNGNCRLSVVSIHDDGMDICVRNTKAQTSNDAEKMAIELAMQLHPDDRTIFTDCQGLEGGRVKWLSRKSNKEADKFASMKGK